MRDTEDEEEAGECEGDEVESAKEREGGLEVSVSNLEEESAEDDVAEVSELDLGTAAKREEAEEECEEKEGLLEISYEEEREDDCLDSKDEFSERGLDIPVQEEPTENKENLR